MSMYMAFYFEDESVVERFTNAKVSTDREESIEIYSEESRHVFALRNDLAMLEIEPVVAELIRDGAYDLLKNEEVRNAHVDRIVESGQDAHYIYLKLTPA